MNFKKWLLSEETTMPEDDGTMGWWQKIPPEKLLDVFAEKDKRAEGSVFSGFNENGIILKDIQKKEKDLFRKILTKQGGYTFDYNKFVAKDTSQDVDINSLAQEIKNYVEQKYAGIITVKQKQNEFLQIDPRKKLLDKFPNHDYWDSTTGSPKDISFPTKMYLSPNIKSTNFLEIGKKIVDYFVENFNFFGGMKFSQDSARRELFVYYLSKLGEENKSKIESDINTMIKRYDPNYKESISTAVDGDDYSGNQSLARIISVYAAAIHMDKDLIQKNLDNILSIGNVGFGTATELLMRNFKNYKPIMNLMQKKGIDINKFVDSFIKSEKKEEKPPETSPDKPQIQSDKTGSIYLGKVHVQLVGNNLKVQGSKAMFDVRLEPNQLQQIASLTKLEAIMGDEPVSPVDYSKGGRSAGIEIKRLGDAEAHISKNALHLNNIQITLNQNQIQYILNMLGMDDTAFDQVNTKNSAVKLTAENGKTVKISNNFFIGKSHFSDAPDFDRFYSERQFNLMKDPTGSWTIQHDPKATNQTYLNGTPLNQPQKLSSGMKVTVGKSGKCPLAIEIK